MSRSLPLTIQLPVQHQQSSVSICKWLLHANRSQLLPATLVWKVDDWLEELASRQMQVEQSKRDRRHVHGLRRGSDGRATEMLSPGQKDTSREQGKQIHGRPDFITSTSPIRNSFVQSSCGYCMSNLLLDCVAIRRPCWEGILSPSLVWKSSKEILHITDWFVPTSMPCLQTN